MQSLWISSSQPHSYFYGIDPPALWPQPLKVARVKTNFSAWLITEQLQKLNRSFTHDGFFSDHFLQQLHGEHRLLSPDDGNSSGAMERVL
ncbi:hypothetical protein [Klebsiella pneumoniae]|uniref:hypothetical protein n=1 Tax=Klebsiella pneumoniae TaxID=573 RepID=UPI0020CEED01|nr:hypothetical protein [Klebsiella pneumoniae]MCQ0851336.1 hypothetical protein [Klebsiella pneumoniae]